ncbi:hypothetical protein Dda_9362 [Drechslerella dactyloides]|uniref:Uncharacterized protein n=1 Tax=Drechslerella dactyloides TaxID=74499 RepID=A0AAD6IPC9_DREDA|nr:hypothetical protein Dda_9362 [Drechslerella dactyloides]
MDYILGPRIDLFEFNDLTWYVTSIPACPTLSHRTLAYPPPIDHRFPAYLRERVQVCLTFCWSISFPNLRNGPSASSALARVLRKELGPSLSTYTFIDFCAGAGGPTQIVERHLNTQLREDGLQPVKFVLTDLYPNPEAWRRIEAASPAVSWVAQPVDAGKAPKKEILLGDDVDGKSGVTGGRKVFRMFNLAFHHFDDDGARRILQDAITGSDAIGWVLSDVPTLIHTDILRIKQCAARVQDDESYANYFSSRVFEIQSRSFSGFLQVAAIGPLLTFLTPFHPPFWTLGHLFFTYIIPILPFVLVFDGYMSALRTRTPQEILALVETIPERDRAGWEWQWGARKFAKPIGEINYFIGVKKPTTRSGDADGDR